MANRPPAQAQPSGKPSCASSPGLPLFTEPEVRRWPHPVTGTPPVPCPLNPGDSSEESCSRIFCALSRQNQLLSEIKALLEHLAGTSAQHSDEK